MIGITERGDAGLNHSWLSFEGPKIVITKAPHLLPIAKMNPKNTIIHCVITGFGGSIIEPNVIPPEEALHYYATLSKVFHTVLRVDPIIPDLQNLVRVRNIIRSVTPGGRIRISFLDAYKHVRDRFRAMALDTIWWEGIHAPLQSRQEALLYLRQSYPQIVYPNIEICGEPGMECTGCVSEADCKFFGIDTKNKLANIRPGCKCLTEKKELLNSRKRCAHKCLYCYWFD